MYFTSVATSVANSVCWTCAPRDRNLNARVSFVDVVVVVDVVDVVVDDVVDVVVDDVVVVAVVAAAAAALARRAV